MTPIAALYESRDYYNLNGWSDVLWGDDGWPVPQTGAAVNVFLLFADGTREFFAAGTFNWRPYFYNAYGYAGTGVSSPERGTVPPEADPAKDDPAAWAISENPGVYASVLAYSSQLSTDALYLTQADADNDTNPIPIDTTPTMGGESWTIHFSVRPLLAGGVAPALFWTSLVDATEKVA